MKIDEKYGEVASAAIIEKTAQALEKNSIKTFVVESGIEAKRKVLELLPEGAEIMTMTSVTLDTLGLAKELNSSTKFKSVRNQLNAVDPKSQGSETRRLGAAHEWAVGSVHAVTQDGQVLVASATGSQLPAYSYGAGRVILVVGAQKIVTDLEDGMRRIYDYTFPLEDERALKAYGVHSGVNKILIINREFQPERITVILVKEKLGF